MQDLANTALNIALQLGATDANVRVMERTVESISVKYGRVEALSSGVESGFNVRVIAHGARGFSCSARRDLAEVQKMAVQAVTVAKASALVGSKPPRLSPLAPQHGSYTTLIKRDPFFVPLEEKVGTKRGCISLSGSPPRRALAPGQRKRRHPNFP